MTEQDLRGFFSDLSEGNVTPLAERLSENCVLEFPGRRFGGCHEGRRKVTVFLRQNQRLFQGGLRFHVRWVGLCDSRGIVQWTNEGTTRKGQPYRNQGVTVFTLDGDRITRIQDYLDTERIAETWPGSPEP